MLIWAPDQVLPVPFSLRARIASPELSFEPEALDFGTCLLGQAVSLPVTLFNRSALPMKYGFVRLPATFSVDPGAGAGFGQPGAELGRVDRFEREQRAVALQAEFARCAESPGGCGQRGMGLFGAHR